MDAIDKQAEILVRAADEIEQHQAYKRKTSKQINVLKNRIELEIEKREELENEFKRLHKQVQKHLLSNGKHRM